MNLVNTIEQFSINNVFFLDRIKNTVMEDSNFIRIIYSNSLFTLNGVYIRLDISTACVEKFYNKYKCIFNVDQNMEIISVISNMERDILQKIDFPNKFPKYKISEQLMAGFVKIFADTNDKQIINSYILKISGIWETPREYGLTFKFIDINHQ